MKDKEIIRTFGRHVGLYKGDAGRTIQVRQHTCIDGRLMLLPALLDIPWEQGEALCEYLEELSRCIRWAVNTAAKLVDEERTFGQCAVVKHDGKWTVQFRDDDGYQEPITPKEALARAQATEKEAKDIRQACLLASQLNELDETKGEG